MLNGIDSPLKATVPLPPSHLLVSTQAQTAEQQAEAAAAAAKLESAKRIAAENALSLVERLNRQVAATEQCFRQMQSLSLRTTRLSDEERSNLKRYRPRYNHRQPDIIRPQDSDVIRLTAMYVGANGPQFQADLLKRESQTSTFGFLHATHPLHLYYCALRDSYQTLASGATADIERYKLVRRSSYYSLSLSCSWFVFLL